MSGAVLAGGASQRFGSDKARHTWQGRTLLEHALGSMQGMYEVFAVGTAGEAGAGVRHVHDLRPGFGPLSGLHAALVHARRPWVAVLACDMPCVPPAFWAFLASRWVQEPPRDPALAIVPEGSFGVEPLAALYRRDLLPALEDAMDRGGAAVRDVRHLVPTRIVPWTEIHQSFPGRIFLNANRPEELP